MSLASDLRRIAARRNADLEEIAQASLVRLGNRVVQGSPVDSGRFRNNWMSAYNSIDDSTDRKNNTSGADSKAALIEKASSLDLNTIFYFTNSLPYANRLEYDGWSAQADAGMVRINVLAWDSIVANEVKKRK